MNYFFVFQNKTFDEESKGGYLWAPKYGNSGRRVSHWEKMKQVKNGDIIIHSYMKNIKAISIAKCDCYSANRPVEIVDEWNNDGWRVDTQYYFFKNCLITSDHMKKLRELQPEVYAPFNIRGYGNTGYLFGATKGMFDYIMQETYRIQFSKDDKDYVASLLEI